MNRKLRESRQALAEDGPADCDQPIPVELEGVIEMGTKQRSEVEAKQDLRRWTLVLGGGGGPRHRHLLFLFLRMSLCLHLTLIWCRLSASPAGLLAPLSQESSGH